MTARLPVCFVLWENKQDNVLLSRSKVADLRPYLRDLAALIASFQWGQAKGPPLNPPTEKVAQTPFVDSASPGKLVQNAVPSANFWNQFCSQELN